jgi:glycosyltransferase involved in cell wall biosynthesis
MQPLLTVCIITYNHARYIRQAINGVLKQEVNFPISILIADDCSKDGTRDILIEYKEKHPDLINLILQEKNVGPAQNWVDLITAPSSKYIAYLEGDDYWIDKTKLQKQVNFLEANPDHSFCFHQAIRLSEQTSGYDVYPQNEISSFNAADFFKMITIPMGSLVYRKAVPIEVIKTHSHGDFLMLCSLLTHGKAYFIKEPMSVYRVHPNGVSYNHSSLGYVNKRLKELETEWEITALSQEVRNQVARIYMQHVLYKIDTYKKDISRVEIVKYMRRFINMRGADTDFSHFFSRLLKHLVK